ncbi:MAG: DEAD/DEAH box helicase [Candidatus Omnitrophica bacterium]|nr:DEAD/DEAH box helicase [Candidatus Omnitrophota bacterium]
MFEYDPFQKQAIDLIDAHTSLLVSAPTGAGKTLIAEYAIEQAMRLGEGAIYTAPIKALSNQKYRDFREKYGDNVGIVTGDVTINHDAPLLIMTTEIYRNRLFENIQKLDRTAWVIFDEIHYLDDSERGTVWEESIMFSPPHIKFICLSATVPNIKELANWMNEVHSRNIQVIIETHRPVPLLHEFQAQGKLIDSFNQLRKQGYLGIPDWSHYAQPRWERRRKRKRSKQHSFKQPKVRPNRIDILIRQVEEDHGLPCIYFCFGRKRTEFLAHELASFCFLSPAEEEKIMGLFNKLCAHYEITNEPTVLTLANLIKQGIAFHHAGMLPTVKEVVERLFTSKLIKLIFTTETFALGINMPAKTVIFDELRKFHGTHFGPLRTRDYYQMAGRAGRRGMDLQGLVISRINPRHISFMEVEKIINGDPEPVMSQFNATYATLLNLYAHYHEKLLDVYPLSFHYYQSSKKGRKRALWNLVRKLDLLKNAGYIKAGALTSKGQFAACMYGYELILSEMLAEGSLDALGEEGLLIVLIALVFEPRKGDHQPYFDKYTKQIMHEVEPFAGRVRKMEKEFNVSPRTKPPFFHLVPAMRAWASGLSFQELQEHTTADEGELVRYFRMTIQLLRLIRQAPSTSAALRQTVNQAVSLINRDEVDAEKQLRA